MSWTSIRMQEPTLASLRHGVAGTLLALILALTFGACKLPEASKPHSHADEHVQGHDHHAAGHGHAPGEVEGFTLWSKDYELFGELTKTPGHAARVLLHLTILSDFQPLSGAGVGLSWETSEGRFETIALKELQPGIFAGQLPLKQDQTLKAKVLVNEKPIWWDDAQSDLLIVGETGQSLHDHAHEDEAHPDDDHAGPHEDHHDHGEIELLKEQQWGIPFATAKVELGTLEPTKEVLGHVEFPPSSTAQVSAPLAGKILPPPEGFPNPGQSVSAGQILARIAPTVQTADQMSQLNLALANAKTALEGRRSELARQQRLAAQNATSQRALEQARRDFDRAAQALKAAQVSARIYKSGAQNAVPVRSPIAGVLTKINVRIGELAAMGQVMFRVSNTQTTWLRTHIPVQWMPQLQQRGPIWVFNDAQRQWQRFDVSSEEGEATRASLLNVAVRADLNTQVVDVLYAIHEHAGDWLEGAAKRVLVPVGSPQKGHLIPRSAIVHARGIDTVYVQVDGEHFVARSVKIDLQVGDIVLIKSGLSHHDRVVTKGAAVVGLAGKVDTPMGHGHLH